MATNNIAKTATAMEDYITVVEVDDATPQIKKPNLQQKSVKRQSSIEEDSSYITVLTINNGLVPSNNVKNKSVEEIRDDECATTTIKTTTSTEIVIVYRLPGERLGFGLKFQGGTRNTEKVHKLYIQSCAKDSPASKVQASWGSLREGDEIVSIDKRSVQDMTRIDCVRCLKDNVAIRLEVRNGYGTIPDTKEDHLEHHTELYADGTIGIMNPLNGHNGNSVTLSKGHLKLGQPPPPPPVPPRKLVKRKSFKDQLPINNYNKSQSTLDTTSQSSHNSDKAFTPPPDAEYYINLFADSQSVFAESESDDTASTISTVIDKFSMSSNYSSETDLSSFASLNTNNANNAQNVVNNAELVKVLKPFTMLEQEYKVNQINGASEVAAAVTKSAAKLIAGNNYENVEFKTEKLNTYENYDFNTQNAIKQNAESEAGPTPKPRNLLPTVMDMSNNNLTCTTSTFLAQSPTSIEKDKLAHIIDVKKRSIIPMPRKYGSTAKVLIEVVPPKVPDDMNLKMPANKIASIAEIATTPIEFTTKIPKAINGGNVQRLAVRAKTESEIKFKANNNNCNFNKKATALFLEQEHKANKTILGGKAAHIKSRIPVVLSPKRSSDGDKITEKNVNGQSPSNIPRIVMQKQKSETDLKLGLYRSKSKESSPVMSKIPLQRTISVESKLKSPERTLIPILSSSISSSGDSTQSLQSTTNTALANKIKGPKPKPPERVQSLPKTHIPKLNLATPLILNINDRDKIPTLQTFRQSPASSAESTPSPTNKTAEIRFKIQTYESKVQQNEHDLPYVDSIDHAENKVPSLYDFVRKHSPVEEKEERESPINTMALQIVADNEEVEAIKQQPLVVGKCIKITANQQTYYSSSSSEGDVDETADDEDLVAEEHDNEKDYICEDGEKLGPPEVINGPGPSEAYFNLYWHSNVLPTIGEVEEECSSLEPQLLSTG